MAVKRYILITGGVAQDISFGPAYLRSFAIGDFKNAIGAPMFVSKIRNSPGNHCYYTNLFHNQKCQIITPSIKGFTLLPNKRLRHYSDTHQTIYEGPQNPDSHQSSL